MDSETHGDWPTRELSDKLLLAAERVKELGPAARDEYRRRCEAEGVDVGLYYHSGFTRGQLEAALRVCNDVLAVYHKTEKFKVGDKVHVVPTTPTTMEYCIRAVVLEVDGTLEGYFLRAFLKDLPGIFIAFKWDKDLEPRVGKARKPTPPELFIPT